MPNPKKKRSPCLSCGKEPARASYKYCSNQCQRDFQYQGYIRRWQKGEIKGLQRLGVVSRHIKRYLRDKYDDSCVLCGWNRVNTYTGVSPLVADHIDGNWRNNHESNLRLLCPNCDALTSTYAGANKGRGRKGRRVSNRIKEARKLMGYENRPSLMDK